MEETKELQSEEICEVFERLKVLAAVTNELDASFAKAFEHLEEARAKIRLNFLTEQNPHGLLKKGDETYLKCL